LSRAPNIGIVIWSGILGGAEALSGAIAQQMRASGIDARVISVTSAAPIDARLAAIGVPCVELGLPRGSAVVPRARRYARLLQETGRDGAVLMTSGYMATALRLGGYRAPLIGVEHGHVMHAVRDSGVKRAVDLLDLELGRRSIDAQVAVSSFMLEELRKLPHRRDAVVIPNGVNLEEFAPGRPPLSEPRTPVIGWAGRMVAGKGVDTLLRAVASLPGDAEAELRLAGDGPERAQLEALAASLGIAERVRFLGRRQDMAGFWNDCDLAVASSGAFIESFGMAPLEASACGRPVIATRNGGFGDVVRDGLTGRIVEPGDAAAIAAAIGAYLDAPERAREDGARGRARAQERFGIAVCARAYLDLLARVGSFSGDRP
jgi:glycosyltransferase involved in cell wall biosynthesis